MRVVKEHDVRRQEIVCAAEHLFHTKGYEGCTINDILKEVGIAKGTFYHYFSSKEDALNAVVAKAIQAIVEKIESQVTAGTMSPIEKLMSVFLAMNVSEEFDEEKLEEIHQAENALLHQKYLSQLILSVSPILAQIVQEGNEIGAWDCDYPFEFMNIFMAASMTLTDGGLFEADQMDQQKIMIALMVLLEKMLSLPKDTLLPMYLENWK